MDEKEKQCFDECMGLKTEVSQAKSLIGIAAFVFLVCIVAVWIGPYFFVDDTYAITRYLILKIPTMCIDILALVGSLVLFDFICPEDTLSTIVRNPMSAALLYSALLIALGLAISFG